MSATFDPFLERDFLAYEEHRTSGVVQKQLSDAGVPFVAGLAGGTGVVGHLEGKAAGGTGLRADMDALPIQEQTGLDYASTHPFVSRLARLTLIATQGLNAKSVDTEPA